MDDTGLIHRIALSMLKGIGPVNARNLVAYCGGVDELFTDKHIRRKLDKVPGIGEKLIGYITDKSIVPKAAKELEYARKHDVRILFYLDDDFPKRLRNCEDAPILLFTKGNADLDAPRTVSIVGTRQPTEHGKRTCEQLVEALVPTGASIISGLAYGIDITAHRAALKHKLPTVASVAHGLDKLYPGEHAATARQMLEAGGLVSELPSGSPFAPGNFPARNRIIAGLGDCTIVIESGPTGGSLITADIANSYDRDVLAYPGRVSDTRSEGCNALIKQNKAALITSADDVIKVMGWEERKKKAPKQSALFVDLSPDEQQLMELLKAKGKVEMDELCLHTRMAQGKVAALLLNMEFNGVVKSLPGKVYALA